MWRLSIGIAAAIGVAWTVSVAVVDLSAHSRCVDPSAGPVLRGVDVVAYRSLDAGANATLGSAEFKADFKGYEFWFSTLENHALFVETPDRYAPSFGGFCGYGIADELFWTKETLGPDANPNVWAIVDDRLLVFMYCTPEHNFFAKNVSEELRRADDIWSTWWPKQDAFNTNCFWDSRVHGTPYDHTRLDCVYPELYL